MKLDCVLYETNVRKELDGTTITALAITRISPKGRTCEGRIACEEHSPDGGSFELEWHARRAKEGYQIAPRSRSGIELQGMLMDNQFTHSSDFDKQLREYISEEIAKSELMKKER